MHSQSFLLFLSKLTENYEPVTMHVQHSESCHAITVRSVTKQLRQVNCGLILNSTSVNSPECMISARFLALIKKFLNARVQFPLGVAWYSWRRVTMKIYVLHNAFLMHVSIIDEKR